MDRRPSQTCTLTRLRRDAVELPSLEVVLLDVEAPKVPLAMDPLVVGSSDDCDVVLADRRVSRRHCSLALTEGGVVLRDLGSKNGTFVGELEIRDAVLVPEMIVSAGGARLTVRVRGESSVLPLSPGARFGEVIGGSLPMRALFARLEHAALTDVKILLRGESGTGKELLARAIHDASPRRDGPFAVFDCGAVAPNVVEAELFGSTRGAFTGAEDRPGVLEAAHGGTLFLDEIGELPVDVQPKLLRVLESGQYRPVGSNAWRPFDARVVSATHRDLRAAMREGTFRADLYYRLAVFEARVPALRERGEDLELLAERILAESSPPRTLRDLPPNTMAMLRSHAFPGNVRELRNVLARLSLFPEMGIEAIERAPASERAGTSSHEGLAPFLAMPLRDAREQVIERFEASYLTAKLRENAGNVAKTAHAIGVSRQFLYRLLERYGLRNET